MDRHNDRPHCVSDSFGSSWYLRSIGGLEAMAQPLMLPGNRSLVPITAEKIEQIQRAVELLKNSPARTAAMIGQVEDRQAGMRPLSKKPDPVREIPDFPLCLLYTSDAADE